MEGLTFDPKTHTYTLKGLPIPSVTQVIAGTQDFLGVPEETMEAARERGNLVHKATAEWDLYGKVSLREAEDKSPELVGYLRAWMAFVGAAAFSPLVIEAPVYSSRYRFAGTIDRAGFIGEEPVILDIKTAASSSRLHPAVGLQLAAYQQAYNESRPPPEKAEGRYAVQLRPDGKYTLTQYTDKGDFSVFLACLTLHNWRKRFT